MFLLINPVLGGILGLVANSYVARTIGTEEYGKLSFALAFVNFFTLFTNLGFSNYLMKEFAKDKGQGENEFSAVLALRLVLALITYLTGAVALQLLGYPSATKVVYYVAGLVIIPTYLTDSCEGVFKGREQMQFIARQRIAYNIIFNVSRCVLVFLGGKAFGLAWNRVVTDFLNMGVALYSLRRHFFKWKMHFSLPLFKKIIAGTLPFAFSTSFLIIYNRIDTVLLSYISGDSAVAYYRSAFVLTENLAIFCIALVGAVYPAIARLSVKDPSKAATLYNRAFFYLFLAAIPIAAGGYQLSEQIISLFYGQEYAPASSPLRLFFMATPFVFATSIIGNVLMAAGHAKLFTYTMTVMCFIDLVADLLLIPIYAHTGAAMATLVAQSINLLLLFIVSRGKIGVLQLNVRYLKVVASAGLMLLALHYFRQANIAVLIMTGAGVFVAANLLLGTMPRAEIEELKNMVFRKG